MAFYNGSQIPMNFVIGDTEVKKDKPSGFENVIANGLTYSEIEWSPAATFRGQTDNGEYLFEEGERYKGVPYSSCKYNDNFIGVNVLLETFITAAKNPNSKLFTRQFFPESVNFKLTTDTSVISGKKYYTRTGTSPNYSFTLVANPTTSAISTYYEKIHEEITYGDTAKVYVPTIQSGSGKVTSGYNNFASTIKGKHVNCNAFYGTVCTTMAKTMYRMPTYETTYSWLRSPYVSKIFDKVYDSTDVETRESFGYEDIMPGDIVIGRSSSSHGHVFVIYEKRATVNSAHSGISVRFDIIQSGYPVVEVAELTDSKYPEKLLGCTISGGVRNYSQGLLVEIYRAKDKDSVDFLSESPLVNIGRETNASFEFNDLIGLDKGNKSHYRVSQAGKVQSTYIASEDLEQSVTVTRFNSSEVSGFAVFNKFGKKLNNSETDFDEGSDVKSINLFSLVSGIPMYYGNVKIVPYKTENGVKKYYTNKYQELLVYDTGDVYDLEIVKVGSQYFLKGKTNLESCGLIPDYVSVSSLDGTIKRTASIRKVKNETLNCFENQFSIELISEGEDIGSTTGKPWVASSTDPDNRGSQLLKVHCYHPWGYCVSLPVTISTLPVTE